MNKILIISDHLVLAGAERLIFEIVTFARSENLDPVILIANNYNTEYYDAIFENMNIPVIRTTLQGIKRLRNPKNLITAIIWHIRLKYFADKLYSSVHVIGLYNVSKVLKSVLHRHRYFWHVGNAVQYFNEEYPFPANIFEDPSDTLIYINSYQAEEIERQYGKGIIKNKISFFKLFINPS